MAESTPRYCQAIKKDGTPCKAVASKTTGLCPAHSPNAREIQVLGGKGRSRQAQLEKRLSKRLRPVLDQLAKAITETHDGTLAPARAQGMASLASALIKISEYAEMESRLKSLEERLKPGGIRNEHR